MYNVLNEAAISEQNFLSLLIENDGHVYNLIEDFPIDTVNYFAREKSRIIYSAMMAVHNAGRPIDLINIVTHLQANSQLDNAGGIAGVSYIAGLEMWRGSRQQQLAAAEDRLRLIKEHYIRREVARFCAFMGNFAKHDNFCDPAKILNLAATELDRVNVLGDDITGQVDEFDNMFAAWSEETAQIMCDNGDALVPTGFACLDRDFLLGGLHKKNLYIVAGRPSMGKSAFAANLASSAANTGKNVLFISLEMPLKQQLDRLISIRTKIPYSICNNPSKGSDGDEPRIIEEGKKIAEQNLFVCDQANLSVSDIEAVARRYRRHFGRLDLLVVDHILLLADSTRRKSDTRAQAVGNNALELRDLAKKWISPLLP